MSVLDTYSRQAHGTAQGATQFKKIDSVPDGTYHFQILTAVINEPAQGVVFSMKLRVLDGIAKDMEIDYDNWLVGDNQQGQREMNQNAVGRLKEELDRLGINHSLWGEFDWFAEFRKAMPLLIGRRFKGNKTTGGKNKKGYLEFVQRLSDAPAGSNPGSVPAANGAVDGNGIPF